MYRVLLVEDEEIELETLRDYIDWKKNGISRVFTARNGRRALVPGRKYGRYCDYGYSDARNEWN